MVIDEFEENLGYYTGDSAWSNWIGPRMPPSDPKYLEVMGQIERIFQSSNRIKECIDRHAQALIGKSPHWYLANVLGEKLPVLDAEILLQKWLTRTSLLASNNDNMLGDPLFTCVKNLLVTGRGYLRLWSPQRFRNNTNPILRIALHSPSPNSVSVERDSDGFIDSISYTYTSDKRQFKEVQTIDKRNNLTLFWVLDETGSTVENFALDLGGRYSVCELTSEALITKSVKRAQNAINYALTLMPRNLNEAGFRERLILGAQPPGRWEDDKFIPDPDFRVGPGVTSFVQGVPILDDLGQLRGYTNPSVATSEPVDVQTFINTAQTFVANIYHEMKQAHLLGSDLQLSGVSREQARQDFETAIHTHARIIESALSSIYGAALMMMLQPNVDKYRDLNVVVQLRLNASQPTPDERRENREDYKAGLRSRVTAMAASGIDDQDAEVALIKSEQAENNVVEDTTSLVTTGVLDRQAGIKLLQQRGRLPKDFNLNSSNDVLNGS